MALCDQDDRWHQDKLEALREATGPEITLAYSDMNLVDENGNAPLADPLDRAAHEPHEHDLADGRQHDHRRRLALSPAAARLRAPLPGSAWSTAFHDHWLALVALASGRIAYVDRSLYDYVQHSANASASAELAGSAVGARGGESGRAGASGVCCRPVPGERRTMAGGSTTSTTPAPRGSTPRSCCCGAERSSRATSAEP